MWLLYVSCAWVAGTLAGSKAGIPLFALCFALFPLALTPLLPAHRRTLIVAGLCLLALLGGAVYHQTSLSSVDEHSLLYYNDGDLVEIRGRVAEETDVRNTYCLLTLSAEEMVVEGVSRKVSGSALVRVPRYPVYHYGDVLKVTGRLHTPPQLDDFDYQGYLGRRGIYSVIYYPRVEIIEGERPFSALVWINSLRNSLSASLVRVLPEPHGSLAQAILLGVRHSVPDSLRQAFSRTGTAHLLSISGLHVSVVLALILSLGVAVFGRQRGIHIWVALATIWIYALLAGMRPPVIRAATMGSLFLMAEYLGRQRSAIIALAFAAAVMVGVQPRVLWSPSFQMSFSAMAGLVLLFPHIQVWGRRVVARVSNGRSVLATGGNIIVDVFSATAAATAAVGPLIAYNFGIISLVSLPATFLALPSLPFIIVTAALVAFAGLFVALAAQVLGWLAWLFLSHLIFVVHRFDALPYSSLDVTVSAWHVWVYYAILASVAAFLAHRDRLADSLSRLTLVLRRIIQSTRRLHSGSAAKWLILPLLTAGILVWSALLAMPGDKLHVSFLDVGQGDAILIQTPGGQNILIDGGPDPQRIILTLSEKLPFWDRTIDLVVCTQPQADHVTGLVEVLRRYEVKQVLDPGVAYGSAVYQEWLGLIEEKGIRFTIARSGQEIDLGNGIVLEVLNPPEQFFERTSCDVDNNGIVMRLTWHEISFMLTADIREEAELDLIMRRSSLRSTVLKAAHHGSVTSTTPQFVAAVDPEVAVISAGSDNPFGHPSPAVVNRLVDWVGEDNLYRTDRQGTIEMITDGKRLWLRTDG